MKATQLDTQLDKDSKAKYTTKSATKSEGKDSESHPISKKPINDTDSEIHDLQFYPEFSIFVKY